MLTRENEDILRATLHRDMVSEEAKRCLSRDHQSQQRRSVLLLSA